jgi:hypothetical protein
LGIITAENEELIFEPLWLKRTTQIEHHLRKIYKNIFNNDK